jgi:hypothetical protein
MPVFVDKLYTAYRVSNGVDKSEYFETMEAAKEEAEFFTRYFNEPFAVRTYGLVELGEIYEYNN